MSVYVIYMVDGRKMMRPVRSREEYLALRNSGLNRAADKQHMVQMNYSCLPNEDGSLKGSKRMSNTIGADIDLNETDNENEKQTHAVRDLILAKKEELGLLMLEESATKGYHVVCRRVPGLNQEENLVRISTILGVPYDKGAKDITRVFYTPADKLIFIEDTIFDPTPALPREGEEKIGGVDNPETIMSSLQDSGGWGRPETQGLHPVLGYVTPSELMSAESTAEHSIGCQPYGEDITKTNMSSLRDSGVLGHPETQGLHPVLGNATPKELTSAESTTETSIGCEPYGEETGKTSSSQDYSLPSPCKGEGPGLGAPCGLDWSAIVSKYIEMFWEGKVPEIGERNAKTFEIAVHLRTICDYRQDVLEAIIPRWAGFPEDEWRQTIKNANNEPKKGIPARIKQVIQALKPLPIAANKSKDETKGDSKKTVSLPPEPPKRLPSFIKLISSKAPKIAKTAVMANIWPAVGVNMSQVKFKYIDNTYHEPTFMCQLIGVQSIGKGYIVLPIESMLRNIRASDKINREREAEYKRKNPVGAKKERDIRPNFVVQCLTENCTDAAFTQRLIDAQNNGEKYLYIRVDEVEQLRKLTSDKRIDSFHLIVRNSFDNHIHGQDRVGADSISGEACLRFNFNASSTPSNAVKFWKKGANDGTLSRLLVSAIIKDETDEELDLDIPIQGEYDDAYYAELQPFLNRLNAANGLIECPQALRLAKTMALENLEKAKLYESGAYKSLCFRANVLAYLKAMCLYVMEGYRWTKDIENFVRWSYEYDMWCKMHFFGSIIENEILAEKNLEIGDPKDIFHLLEKEFTYQEYMEMRVKEGKKGDGKSLLCMWKKRKKVYYDQERQLYVKL